MKKQIIRLRIKAGEIENPSEKDYYFGRPVKNNFTNEELYEMEILEINIGIHPTIYNNNKNNKSFHPFFYLKLHREDIQDFGVIVQYLKIPNIVELNQTHIYEDDGVEFIEKDKGTFDKELIKILNFGADVKTASSSEYLITYNSKEFDPMTLGDFFHRAIPVKGIWLQKEIKPKGEKNCMAFCIESIKNLNLKKKKITSSLKKIHNMKMALITANESENFELYKKGLDKLFRVIFEDL